MNNQRATISQKNKYWIPKFRYLELKNWCLQYPDWKKDLASISELKTHSQIFPSGNFSDSTLATVLMRDKFLVNITLLEDIAKQADDFLAPWIIKGVTENISYDYLHLKLDMPTSRDTYYDRYRRFFWLLDQKRP